MNSTFTSTIDDAINTPSSRWDFNIHHFTSNTFIIWYCFLLFCFLSAVCCFGVTYMRYLHRINSIPADIPDSTARRARETDSWDLVRIQQNIRIFSERTKKGRRKRLVKALNSQKMVRLETWLYLRNKHSLRMYFSNTHSSFCMSGNKKGLST